MPTSAPAQDATSEQPNPPSGALDRYFKITERGSTLSREVRGGFATFFAMAYIIVLNPIILAAPRTCTATSWTTASWSPPPC